MKIAHLWAFIPYPTGATKMVNICTVVFFSSPELKAQVSFSDCLLSVNFSHFELLLQNHWANFNQTWHKASLGKEDSNLFN